MTRRQIVTLVVAAAITLSASWRAEAQVPVGFEELAVSTAAVPITETVYRPATGGIEATNCFAQVEDASLRYRLDGTAPTSSVGTLADDGALIPLGADSIRNFQAIRSGAVDASLQIACFRGEGILPIPRPKEIIQTISSAVADELADFTITSEEANLLDGGGISWRAATITETAAAAASATYTASFIVPANSIIVDLQVHGEVVWGDGAGADMDCGDTADPNGIYAAADLLTAADLLPGEALTFEHPGGVAGADLATEQRDFFKAAGTTVSCVVTVTTSDGATGVTHVVLGYAVTDTPTAVTFVDP